MFRMHRGGGAGAWGGPGAAHRPGRGETGAGCCHSRLALAPPGPPTGQGVGKPGRDAATPAWRSLPPARPPAGAWGKQVSPPHSTGAGMPDTPGVWGGAQDASSHPTPVTETG